MVYGPAQCWHSWAGNAAAKSDFIQELFVETDRLFMPPALLENFLQHVGATPCPSSALVRRSITERIGQFEESFRGMYEDQVFFSKVCLAAPIFVSSEGNFNYRRHPNAACAVPRTKKDISSSAADLFELAQGSSVKTEGEGSRGMEGFADGPAGHELQPYPPPLLYHLLQYATRFAVTFERFVRAAARWGIPAPVRFWLRGR